MFLNGFKSLQHANHIPYDFIGIPHPFNGLLPLLIRRVRLLLKPEFYPLVEYVDIAICFHAEYLKVLEKPTDIISEIYRLVYAIG